MNEQISAGLPGHVAVQRRNWCPGGTTDEEIEQTGLEEQKEQILKALDQTQNNKTAAAKLLGITFRAFRYRLKKLGLD